MPYFSQWESAELVGRFIAGSLRVADDPRWAESGARTQQEYEYWAGKVCGLACLKMVMASRGIPVAPTMMLLERALTRKAYIRSGEHVQGLIYQPFASWIGEDYGIGAEVMPNLSLDVLAAHASPRAPVIASVHKWVRWPASNPPSRGGHLVLVTGVRDGVFRLHNPSGLPGVSQCDALIRQADFTRFFAWRGVMIKA